MNGQAGAGDPRLGLLWFPAEHPVAERSAADRPVADHPATERPAAGRPAGRAEPGVPVLNVPVPDRPVADVSAADGLVPNVPAGAVPPPDAPASAAGGVPGGAPAAPVLRHRRDGILPAVAAVLSVRGAKLTCTGSKGDQPAELHPLVRDFLDTLGTGLRERHDGRCPEAVLLSRFLTSTEESRKSRRAARKPLSHSEAKRALKHAKLTARRIREDGDPLHGSYAPPCRSCATLLDHFGVRAVAPGPEEVR
ncbi:hypothetical protein DVA86_31535 [Streptomyces armeniacus]|uniref:Deaminase n=1 Tax=Streptomyces armeniacus TaxID=83291 RepID=A0A345Y1N4_9ACTN|nr:hypothetical protein DVA86_31535 [Streptomyces armeniacus]